MATLHLRHLSGKEALEKFTTAIAEFYDGNVIRQVIIHTNIMDGHVRLENIATRVLTSQLPIKKLADLLADRPFLYCRQITAAFDHGESIQYSTDGILATIDINGPSHMPPERFADQLIRMTDVLGKHFTLTRKPEVLNEHLTAEQRDGLRHYEQALSDLTTQTAQLGRMAATQMQESQKVLDQRLADLEKRYDQRSQTLEADYQARCQQLDRRAQELEAQHQQRLQALEPEYEAKKQDLEHREQELKAQVQQQLHTLETADEARKQDLERREQELKNRYEQRVRTLEADHQTRGQDLERRQQDLEKRYEQRAQTLEADYQAKRLDLDRRAEELKHQAEQRVQSLEANYQAKSQELNRREQELKALAEQCDVRARAVTRRDLVQKMQELIEKQKDVATSPDVEQKRKLLHQVCLAVLGGFGALLIFVVLAIVIKQQTAWQQTILPLAVVTLGFGSTLAFYLRSNHQWLAEHARTELANRKLGSDILRANWIAELFMESKENSRIELPEGLLLTFAQGLFSDAPGEIGQPMNHRLRHLVPSEGNLAVGGNGKHAE
ncbi:MAG: hypothetical protein ACM359_10825 [Bacillota bacterium]